MCFVYGTFICLNKTKPEARYWLAAALLIALASITRSAGLALIVAFSLSLLIRRPDRYLTLILISATPFLYWYLFKNVLLSSESYFGVALDSASQRSITGLLLAVPDKLMTIKEAWYWLFSVIEHPLLPKFVIACIHAVLFLSFLHGLYRRLTAIKTDAIFLCVYFAIILAWPYSDLHFVSRFLYPLLPLIIFYIWLGIHSTGTENIKRNYAFGFCLLCLIAVAFPASGRFINRAYMEIDTELKPYRRNRFWLLPESDEQAKKVILSKKQLIETLPLVEEHVAEGECIYALQTPIVMLYTKRISKVFPFLYSETQFAHPEADCQFYLAMPLTDIEKSYPAYYPLEQVLNSDRFHITPLFAPESKQEKPIFFLIKFILN